MSQDEWVGGIHVVNALLRQGAERIKRLRVDREIRDRDHRLAAILIQAEQLGIPVEFARSERLNSLVDGLHHQGILACTRPRKKLTERDLPEIAGNEDLWLVLDGVTDPHNLGACLRSVDAAGASGLVVPRDRSASLTPSAIKVASGAADTVPLYSVSNLARTLNRLRDSGVWVVGLAGEAEQELFSVDLSGPIALVVGNEGEGLRRLTRESCDFLVSIPLRGSVESLNVSVAAGIALFEARRQRK